MEAVMGGLTTDWQYDTSEDTSVSLLLVSAGSGTLYLKNAQTGERMTIPYSYIGLGESKGSDLGVSQSTTDMQSSGGTVVTYSGDFYAGQFPCKGFLLTAGAVADILGANQGAASQAYCEYLFGFPVFAGVTCQGQYNATMPGVGISCATVSYGYATNAAPSAPVDPNTSVADNGSDGGGDDSLASA
jgi:hypothetical protein